MLKSTKNTNREPVLIVSQCKTKISALQFIALKELKERQKPNRVQYLNIYNIPKGINWEKNKCKLHSHIDDDGSHDIESMFMVFNILKLTL